MTVLIKLYYISKKQMLSCCIKYKGIYSTFNKNVTLGYAENRRTHIPVFFCNITVCTIIYFESIRTYMAVSFKNVIGHNSQ